MTNRLHSLTAEALCLSLLLYAVPVCADELYKGKTVNMVIGHEPGSGFDVYARLFAPHLARHIPGRPNVVVQNMIGASGMIAANWLYNIAPKDGTVIANFSGTVTFDPLLGSTAAKFAPDKFSWIGNLDENVSLCGVSKASGIEKLEDLIKKETAFGATGAAGPFGKFANAVKNLLGLKIKVVSGYKGSASVRIALLRGEVNGICGLPYTTLRSHWNDEYQSGEFKIILQLSGKAHPALKGVPHVNDFARSKEDRKVFDLIFGVQVLGRVYAAPPGIPASYRAALRKAFDATVSDPAFLADAKKAKIEINAATGKEVEDFITSMSSASSAVVRRAREALSH